MKAASKPSHPGPRPAPATDPPPARRPTLDAIVAIGGSLTSILSLDEVLPAIARQIAEALDVSGCDLYDYDPSRNVLVASATWAAQMSERDLAWVGTEVDLSAERFYWPVLDQRRTVAAYADDPDLGPTERRLMDGWGELAALAAPLVFEGNVIGCITLIEKRLPRRFGPADHELLQALVVPAAVALHNARLYRRLEEKTRQLESLLESSRAISSSLELDDVLATVARTAAEALGSPECVIFEHLAEIDALAYRSVFQPEPRRMTDDPLGTIYPLSEYPTDRAVLLGGVPVEERVSDPDLSRVVRDDLVSWGEKSCLSVPLVFEGRPLGMMCLVETEVERHFRRDEVELAATLGKQAAIALNNARQYRRQEVQNRRLLALLESSRGMTAALDEQQAFANLKSELAELLGGGDCRVAVSLPRIDTNDGADLALDGDGSPSPVDDAGDGLVAAARAARRPVQADEGDDRVRVVIPLILRGEARGHVEILGPRARRFGDDELEFAQIVANQTAATVENARLYEAIEHQAVTDAATGLYDQRFFFERLAAELARARRYATPLALLIVDVDDFRWLNDRCGRRVGDDVLRTLARQLERGLRSGVDVACRYGGDQFALILPSTALDAAVVAAERLREAIDDAHATHEGGEVDVGHVTVSIGVAAYPEHAPDVSGLVAMAELAMLAAKKRGKNCVDRAPLWA